MLEFEDSLSSPVIINAAITGMVPTKQDNPNVPLTVEEIASDVALVVEAGVSVSICIPVILKPNLPLIR